MKPERSASDPIKVYDARWEVGEFDAAQVRRLFEATLTYGRELGVDTVTLARDARPEAAPVLELAVEVALERGFEVFLRPEPISTPQSYYTTARITLDHPATMGLTVTASHNPAGWVGVKFTVPSVRAIGLDCGPAGGLRRVRELYHGGAACEAKGRGHLEVVDFGHDYVDDALLRSGTRRGSLGGMHVVVDTFHGSAGPEIHRALREAGVEVTALRLVPDGSYPTGSPNPTSLGKMDHAVALARELEADAVIGVDGDGDRLVFGDGRGVLTAGCVAIAVLEGAGLADHEPAARVLYDPKVSPLALEEWGRLGVQPVLFRNGHSQIKEYMTQVGAHAAVEESGHYYHRMGFGDLEVSCENSLLTLLLFLRDVKRHSGLMDQLQELQRREYTTGEFNYQFADDGQRDRAQQELIEFLVADGARACHTTVDGIELGGTTLQKGVEVHRGRLVLRRPWYSGYLRAATNERGVVRSYFSTDDSGLGRRIEERARALFEERGGRLID